MPNYHDTHEQERRRESSGAEVFEAWWLAIARMLAFVLGAYLLVKQQSLSKEEQSYWLQIIAAGCCGPVVANAVAAIVTAARGGSA